MDGFSFNPQPSAENSRSTEDLLCVWTQGRRLTADSVTLHLKGICLYKVQRALFLTTSRYWLQEELKSFLLRALLPYEYLWLHIHRCSRETAINFQEGQDFFWTKVAFARTLLEIILLVDFSILLSYQSVFSGFGFYRRLSSDSWLHVFFVLCVTQVFKYTPAEIASTSEENIFLGRSLAFCSLYWLSDPGCEKLPQNCHFREYWRAGNFSVSLLLNHQSIFSR